MRAEPLILSYVESYGAESVAPFVESLDSAGVTGSTVFFTSAVQPSCSALLRRHGVDEMPIRRPDLKGTYRLDGRLGRSLGIDGVRFVPDITINRRLSRLIARLDLSASGVARSVARTFWHCLSARFLYFEEFLQAHPEYDPILIADVRDVVFQADPFAALPAGTGLHLFEEYGGTPLGSQENNADWIRKLYGPAALDRLSDMPVICAGVIAGGRGAILDLLRRIGREVMTRYNGWGTDQGALNYLARSELLPDVTVYPYGSGPVAHVGIAPRETIATDAEGRVLTREGTVVPVVHQYDRHDDLAEALLQRIASTGAAPVRA